MIRKILTFSAGLLFLVTTAQATATEYNSVIDKDSKVTFDYRQMGVPMSGHFAKFNAEVNFNPQKVDQANAQVEINIASIDTGSSEADDEVVGKPWFNTKAFPTATFTATGMRALGGDRYEATGKLSIKGQTRDVIVPITFVTKDKQGVFSGTLSIRRLDYAIGEGIWADLSAVANEIKINFRIAVTSK